jgi:tRNA (guanine-N7-)-methyltransferase
MGASRPRRRFETGVQTLSLPPPSSRFYGRRKGRPLRRRKGVLLKTLLPQVQIVLPEKDSLVPHALFTHPSKAIWLEIGFGGGEHLAAQARNNPEIGLIGCEPFLNGIANLLGHIETQQLTNVRIFPDDARRILDAMPGACIDRCFVLFADPWPKARHKTRRFIGSENIPRLARVLAPGAELRLATDDEKLAAWMKACLLESDDFKLVRLAMEPPEDWIQTRYEHKALEAGRAPIYMSYKRI